MLKTRSEAALDALMLRYFLASSESVGYDDEYSFHHLRWRVHINIHIIHKLIIYSVLLFVISGKQRI